MTFLLSNISTVCFAPLLLLFISVDLQAQTAKPFEDRFPALQRVYQFVNYSTAQGLPAEDCRGGILMDSDGFLWVGSVNGLSRFNGHEFEVFRNNPSDSNSVGGNHLVSGLEDKDGFVWISPGERGVNRFDKGTGTFRRFSHDPEDSSSLSDDIILVIFQDRNQNLWFGGERGLNKLTALSRRLHDEPRVSFVRYVHRAADPNSLSEGRILWMSEESAGTLLIGSDRWVDRYDPRVDTFAHFKVDPRIPPELQDKMPLRGFEDGDQMVWFRTPSSLYRYARTPSSLHLIWPLMKGPAINWTWAPYQDSKGSIWMAHQEGVIRVDPSSFQVTHFAHKKSMVRFTRDDNAGNIWFGTAQGLDKLTLNARRFSRLFLGADSIRTFNALGEDDDGSLMGCRGPNIIRLSPSRASVDSIAIESYPVDFCTDDGGTGWVATWGGGLYEIDKMRRKAIAHEGDSLDPHSIISSLCKGAGGTLWLGAYSGGLHAFDTHTKKCIKQYRHDPHSSNSISNGRVVSLLRDSQGFIWIGTELAGLNRFDPRTETFSVWRHNHRDSTSLSGDLIYALYEDDNGDIWAGADNGLNKFNRLNQSFTRYLKRENTSNSVQTIARGDEHSLWVGYYDGALSRFDLRSGTFKTFLAETGLLSKEQWRTQIARGRSYKSKWSSGELVFNTTNGILVFCPDSIQESKFNPQVVLSRLSVFETSMRLLRAGGEYQPIKVPYDSNFLSLEFVALDLTTPEHNQYAYMLQGYEENWNYIGNKREAKYTKVSPGEYVFRVKGTNSDGVWSTNEVSLKIVITPPWWKTTWAYGSYCVFVVAGLYSLRRFEKKRDRLKQQAELDRVESEKRLQQEFSKQVIETQEAERKRVASELHDSLGQHLLIVNNELQLYQQGKGENDPDIQRTTSIVKDAIKEVREIAANLHPHHLEKLGLRAAVEAMIEQVSRSTPVKFDAVVADVDSKLSMQTKINLYRVLQEAIANIVRHSGATKASITIRETDNGLQATIEDNGKGFAQGSSQGGRQGFGLKSMTERMNLVGGTMTVDSSPGKGTTIQIIIPIHN